MLRYISLITTLLSIGLVATANAELETLASETAREEVANMEGVVVVDLFAEW